MYTRFLRYTPLTSHKSCVLKEVMQTYLIPPPKKFQTLSNVNMKKHYRYYHNYYHTTNECATLKEKVEELIQADHLKWFVRWDYEGCLCVDY